MQVAHYTEVKSIPIDPKDWKIITDAMARVLLPEGTAPSAHIPGIDIAGKTGRAQTSRWQLRAKKREQRGVQRRMDGSWASRRGAIRTIVVCVLFEGGEHGRLAARLATQVIKAYVEKQRRKPTKMVEAEGRRQGRSRGLVDRPRRATATDKLQSGHFWCWTWRR